MNYSEVLSKDELEILEAFRNGDRITRARILLATMAKDRDDTPEELLKLQFFGAYLDADETGRARILEAAQMFASGKSQEEVDQHMASLGIKAARKADVIDIAARRAQPPAPAVDTAPSASE